MKDILVSMRKDQQYRQTKMLLLHKLAGLAVLREQYNGDPEAKKWFKGFARYSSKTYVIRNFVGGVNPISCFRSGTDRRKFHILFSSGIALSIVKYITLNQLSSHYVNETGLHFTKFSIAKDDEDEIDVNTISRDDLDDLMGECALLLPYKKKGCRFQNQFTVMYNDHSVLCCKSGAEDKGFPSPDSEVFTEELLQDLFLM